VTAIWSAVVDTVVLEVHAVGVGRTRRAPPGGRVVDAGKAQRRLQSAPPPLVGVGELPLAS
jgi:hypothetical protein